MIIPLDIALPHQAAEFSIYGDRFIYREGVSWWVCIGTHAFYFDRGAARVGVTTCAPDLIFRDGFSR